MGEDSETQTERIEGEVVQILSPEDHSGYCIGEQLAKYAEGKYIVVLNTDEKPGRLGRFKEWLTPGGPPDWAPTLVLDTVDFEEGDRISVPAEKAVYQEEFDDIYRAEGYPRRVES